MRKLLTSLLILSMTLSGCVSYVDTNCSAGGYAHCDDNRDKRISSSRSGERYLIRDNLLYLETGDSLSPTQASKEDVLEFVLQNENFVVMYDPLSGIATIHRRVYSYEGKAGEVLLGMALIIVGSATVIALARSQESCYDKHISKYRQHREATNRNIFQSGHKGVGSERWHKDIDISSDNARKELSRAFACF